MKRSLFTILFTTLILLSFSMLVGQNNPETKAEGVNFVKKSLSETLVLAKKQNKLVMLDAFSFN